MLWSRFGFGIDTLAQLIGFRLFLKLTTPGFDTTAYRSVDPGCCLWSICGELLPGPMPIMEPPPPLCPLWRDLGTVDTWLASGTVCSGGVLARDLGIAEHGGVSIFDLGYDTTEFTVLVLAGLGMSDTEWPLQVDEG